MKKPKVTWALEWAEWQLNKNNGTPTPGAKNAAALLLKLEIDGTIKRTPKP